MRPARERESWQHGRGGIRLLRASGIDSENAARIADAVLDTTRPRRVLHETAKRRIFTVDSVLGSPAPTVLVKEIRAPDLLGRLKNLLRSPPARRAWRALSEAAARGVPAPRPYVYVEDRAGATAYIVMEYLDGWKRPIHDLVGVLRRSDDEGCRSRQRAFLLALAAAARGLHEAGVYHRDFSAYNLLAREEDGAWKIAFIDFDAASFPSRLRLDQRIRALAKLDDSFDSIFSRADRLRFLKAYAGGPSPLLERKSIGRILEINAARKRRERARRRR